MSRIPAMAVIAAAGLLAACTVTENRTPAHIVMKGARQQVEPLASDVSRRFSAKVSITPGGPGDAVEATLVLPVQAHGDQLTSVMTRCINAGLSCTIESESVRRDFHLG